MDHNINVQNGFILLEVQWQAVANLDFGNPEVLFRTTEGYYTLDLGLRRYLHYLGYIQGS